MKPLSLTPLKLEPSDRPDAELVERARRGEDYAFDALYRRHVQFVAAVVFRLDRRPSEVDDLVQETFVTAFAELGRLKDPQALRGWLAQIAISRVNRRQRWFRLLRFFQDEQEEQTHLDAMASPDASPEVRAQLSQIDAALEKLDLQIRTAWVLRFVLGCTLEEVAQGCDCSLATAKRRLSRAEQQMQDVTRFE